MRNRRVLQLLALASLAGASVAGAQTRGGPLPDPLVATDNWWSADVSSAPVDPASAAYISFIGVDRGMHPDFGGAYDPCGIYGIPYATVGAGQPKRAVEFDYWDESDGVDYSTGAGIPFYPIPDEAITQCQWIEGGPPGDEQPGGDRHMLLVDVDNRHLYELFNLRWVGGQWRAGSGAFFDLKTNARRPEGWTSADAAGLAILPGLVRYDEVHGTEEIEHAFRVTVRATNGHVYPASHRAGSTTSALPLGARLRLKSGKDISGFPAEVQRIFRAMKRYGLIVADNGSDMFVSGVFDDRWDNGVLNPAFAAIKASDFEVIQLGWRPASAEPAILSFAATPDLVPDGECTTLSWDVAPGSNVSLDGSTVAAVDATVVCPTGSTTYTLSAANASESVARTVRVQADDGTAGLAVPSPTAPDAGQTILVSAVTLAWVAISGATAYDLRVWREGTGETVFSGSLAGEGSTSSLVSLSDGSYQFGVRACAGGVSAAQCGAFGSVSFTVSLAAPSAAPTITAPTPGAALTFSTQVLSWTPVTPNPALPDMTYEVRLHDRAAGTTALQISVPHPTTSTVFTLSSSSDYELEVRACQAGCGPWSAPVSFTVSLGTVPTSGPTISSCSVSGGNSLTCAWSSVSSADFYQIQVIQPDTGPGGGALTVAARQVSGASATFPVPSGPASVLVWACNGDGCGPASGVYGINPAGPNPTLPTLGTPMGGSVAGGPYVLFTWSRVPGDDGSNTTYRLYARDFSRQDTALDILTTNNFWGAYLKAEGTRYDALVIVNPDATGAGGTAGPAASFNLSGSSAQTPTMVQPIHQSEVPAGNVFLGWSPVEGAGLYEYYVASGANVVRGVTPGLLVQVPLEATGDVWNGITRACLAGDTCTSESPTGWGPWSNEPGGTGVTQFTVLSAPSVDDPATGVHALAYYEYDANDRTSITTPPMATQSSGSTILVGVGRGDHSAHATPSDNKGNTYVPLGTSHTYTNWVDSGTALYASQGTLSGGSAHQVTVATAAYDETTVAVVEIKNGGSIEDHKWNEDLANPATSLGVTTSGPAVLVAFWFGDGGIGSAHSATPNNGFSIVESLPLDGGLVQLTVATRAVSAAGTYDVEWDAPSGEGAQLYLVAVRH